MKTNNKKIFASLAIVVIFGVITLITHTKTSKNTTKIKIGVIVPLSGEGAQFGEEIKNGIEIALKQNNLRDRFEIIYEDGKIDPKTSLSAYQKLSSLDKVNIIIGPLGPNTTLAVAPTLRKDRTHSDFPNSSL